MRRVSDAILVLIVLVLGGAFYLALMLWTTAKAVRESDANNPPPGSQH
jgi:threonine/homoserine/homoserine lactone efflux protein